MIKYFNPSFGNSFNQRFRENRFKFFLTLLEKVKSDQVILILDIGGTSSFWERMNFIANKQVHITLLNLVKEPTHHGTFKSIEGDACDLSLFKDQEFDVVFSNSVIEHLFCIENQQKMSDEVRRVGKFYYVQTPNFFFPIEPHWLFPFFQFLPIKARVFLTHHFNLGHYKKSTNRADAVKRVEEIKLLTEKQMKNNFPDGKVYHEVFLGLVKSITLYRFPEN